MFHYAVVYHVTLLYVGILVVLSSGPLVSFTFGPSVLGLVFVPSFVLPAGSVPFPSRVGALQVGIRALVLIDDNNFISTLVSCIYGESD